MMKDEGRRQKEKSSKLLRLFLILFCLLPSAFCLSPPAFAQVKGEVESVGFENIYRPDCWTPMVVRLTPETDKAGDYLIRVHQEDLDRDQPTYIRQVTVTGVSEGRTALDQRFRVYFKPTPTDGGLPDANDVTTNLAQLQKKLSVELCTTGGKFIATLPITSTILNLDGPGSRRGTRLVLAVNAGRSAPARREYDPDATIGMLEDVAMVPVNVRDLPESVLGYDAVDDVLWLDADPSELSSGGDEKLRALQNFVRGGGHLVICQPGDQWQKTLQFGDMLPVTVEGVRPKSDTDPLRSLSRSTARSTVRRTRSWNDPSADPWDRLRGPMTLGVAVPRPGAIVDQWIDWTGSGAAGGGTGSGVGTGPDITPYIARKAYGCGCVSWVAQDLGDPAITRVATTNWPLVWNQVFDWKDDPIVVTPTVSEDERDMYALSHASLADAGHSLIERMDLGSRSLWLITVAVIFFIAYWLVAGPGAYLYLVTKGRASASWFVFAAAALVFTLLTLGLVSVMLRGPPDLKHLSVVRDTSGQPVHVYSRFGLYIPRDGEQRLELKESAPGTVADMTAFAIHPAHLRDNAPNDIGPPYEVHVSDASSGEPALVRFPYRRTLKKLEADWVGDPSAIGLSGGIEGSGKLIDASFIEGKLTNGTGKKLRDVYIAFKYKLPPPGSVDQREGDWLLYIPEWASGVTLDMNKEFNTYIDHDGKSGRVPFIGSEGVAPQQGRKVRGQIQGQVSWSEYWLKGINNGIDDTVEFNRSLAMLSFFGRIPPDRKTKEKTDRFELLRRGARRFDASAALASGAMVIIAENDPDSPNPLPMPLEVEGERVGGSGVTLYQFVVPMDNSFATTPTTRPEGN